MSFVEAVRTGLSKYGRLQGRASRAEYWWLLLASWLVIIAVVALAAATQSTLVAMLAALAWIGCLIPIISVGVRRLHDTGRSGWWWLISFVPFGGVAFLVFMLLPGDPMINRFGSPPVTGIANPALA